MSLQTQLKAVGRSDLNRINEQTLTLLEQTGVAFHSEEALTVFNAAGARVEGEVVHLTAKMVEQALKTAPKQFTWHARNPDNNIQVGGNQDQVHVMLDHGSVYIQDLDSGRRHSTLEDLANLYKLGQASEVCNIIGQVPVDPSDVDDTIKHLVITQTLLRHTDKPIMSYPVDNQDQTNDIFEMIEKAYGKGYLDTHPTVGVSVCALSPLKFAPESCDTLIAYAKRKQPTLVLTCAMSGVTAPVGLMGTAILQNAEILAGLVLTQLVNPGNPFIYCPASAVPNMKTAGYITGSPESNLINIIGLQLAHELYNLPTRTMAGLTDAKVVDCQAGYETMQNLFTLMLSGTNLINECVGTLDSIMTVSYEKFMLDQEMISRTQRIKKGISTTVEDFDISVIQEIGQTGSYLMHPTTAMNCRSMWTPMLSNWDSYADWQKGGAEDLVFRANRKYKEVLSNCPSCMLEQHIDDQLAAFIDGRK